MRLARVAAIATCLTMAAGVAPASAAQRAASGAASGAASPQTAAGRVLPDKPLDVVRVPAPLQAGVAESLRRLVAAAGRNSAFDRPVGFDVEWVPRARDYPDSSQATPVRFTPYASLHAHARSRGTGVVTRTAQDGASFNVYANSIGPVLAHNEWGEKDERGTQLYLEPVRDGSVGGVPHYGSSGMVVLTRIARPLWVPVPRERAIRAEMRAKRAFNDKLPGTTAQFRQVLSDSALQEWVRQRPQRERAFRQAYEQAKKRDPAYAERLRVSHVRMEAEYEKQMRATMAQMPAIERTGEEIRQGQEECIRFLEEHLASLSPAERAAPAAISVSLDAWTHRNANAWSRGCSTIAAAPGRETRLIVEANPDFFDRTQPRSAIQLIIVDTDFLATMGNPRVPRHLKELVFPRIKAGVDWQALAALLSGR